MPIYKVLPTYNFDIEKFDKICLKQKMNTMKIAQNLRKFSSNFLQTFMERNLQNILKDLACLIKGSTFQNVPCKKAYF